MCVEELTSAIQEATAVSGKKSRHRADPGPIYLLVFRKKRLRMRWKVTTYPALKPQVNLHQRSMIHRLNEWTNEQWSRTLQSLEIED
jgi:hypothetical protein